MEIAPSKANATNQQGATRKIVSVQWEQKPVVNSGLNTGRLYSDGKQSAEKGFQSLAVHKKSWFGKNPFYIWEYQQHIGGSSQKIVFILHSSFHGESEMRVPGDISHANT